MKHVEERVFVIGTCKDKLDSSKRERIVADLNKYLKSLLKENGFRQLVHPAGEDKVIFTVNNHSSPDSYEDFEPIRSKVTSLIIEGNSKISKMFTRKYPISYLLFSLELQSLDRSVVSFDDCKKMAKRYGIDKESDVIKLLEFLHVSVGIIRYFNKKGVRDIVINKPQVLFDSISSIVIKTFISGSYWSEDFMKKGILTETAVKKVVGDKDGISPDQFLQLLTHLRIAARFTDERYFIPSVLNHIPESRAWMFWRKIVGYFTSQNRLAIKFKCEHCPKGLFGVLVTYLMNSPQESECTRKRDLN